MAYIGSLAPSSSATRTGQALGSGLGSGLEALAKQKLEQMVSEKKQKEFQKAGLTPEESYLLYEFRNNPAAQEKLLSGFLQNPGRPQGSQEQDQFGVFNQMEQAQEKQPFDVFNEPQRPEVPKKIGLNDIFQLLQGGMPQSLLGQQGQPTQQQPQQRQMQTQPVQPQPQMRSTQTPQRPQIGQPQQPNRPVLGNQQRVSQIERVNKPYNDALDKRLTSAQEVLDKGNQMLNLLENGDVASGWKGAYLPYRTLGTDSEDFNGLGDDAAAALTGLQSGVQTQSKIKFNKERKANLGQNRETQFRRVKDMIKTANKVLFEGDIRRSLVESGQIQNLSSSVGKIYSQLSSDIPDVPEGAEIGQEFVDPKTKAIWTVAGNRMRFDGFAQRRK